MDCQRYINNAIRDALHDFASAYLDDVLIYSDSEEEHVGHVKWKMQWLLKAGLYLQLEKCEFHKETVRYVGLIISTKGISMDEDTVETVQNWSREMNINTGCLNNLCEEQQFHGICNYYRLVLPEYYEKAELLARLAGKDQLFV